MPAKVGEYPMDQLACIGLGPFGPVFHGESRDDRKEVIKVSWGGLISRQEHEEFISKLRLVMQLKQPYIANVYEVGLVGDQVYVVSDYVEGVDLSEYLLEPKLQLSFREAALLCGHIAAVLHHAHRFGVFHGNLKPSNIRLKSDQSPCLFDFSINNRANVLQHRTDGGIIGSAAYLAPEQLLSKSWEVNAPTDVYAVGAILYELLTGQRPFCGADLDLLKRIAKGVPKPPRAINPDIPKPLEIICMACLETEPNNRYGSALELAKELRLFLEDKPIQTKPRGILTRLGRWWHRRY